MSLIVGIGMVRSGNEFAFRTRDAIVGEAVASNPATLALRRGAAGTAAVIDFARNVGLGAVPTTVLGLAVIAPYPIVAYRGWVGGIVSTRDDRTNRLDEAGSATVGAILAVTAVVLGLITRSRVSPAQKAGTCEARSRGRRPPGRSTSTPPSSYEISIEGRDEWVAAARRRARDHGTDGDPAVRPTGCQRGPSVARRNGWSASGRADDEERAVRWLRPGRHRFPGGYDRP